MYCAWPEQARKAAESTARLVLDAVQKVPDAEQRMGLAIAAA